MTETIHPINQPRKRKSLFGAKEHPSQRPKRPTIPSRKGPGGSKISSKPLAERLPVEGTAAYGAMTRLDVTLDQLRKSPDISQILARSVGPRQRVIDSLRFSTDPAAVEFLDIYDDMPKGDRQNVPFEAICIKGQISPSAVLGAVMMAARLVGAQESAITAVIEHPEVLRKTIQYAKELPGAFADRRIIHEAVGFLPRPGGGSNVNVNLNSGNPQLAEEDDDEKTFETAFPSVNQELEKWGEKRRKLLEGGR
jgi:hypothetical protein